VFRLFLAFNLLLLNLYACKGGYASCVSKVRDSHSIQNCSVSVPTSTQQRVIYSHCLVNKKILKYDPFLSLYLVEDKPGFRYPFDINMRLQLGVAMVNDKIAREGTFTQNQIGLNTLAKFSEPLIYPAIVSSSCCSLEGIVTQRGIIQKEYLHRFVDIKHPTYADIGIRIKDENGLVIVNARDPFMKHNPFVIGDCIVAYDKKRVQSASSLMRAILFSKIGSKHSVKIKRDNKILTFDVVSMQRYGGGDISDTFLEQKGIFFDKTLAISKLNGVFKSYGLQVGDRLIQVNGKRVKTQKELREYIEKFKDYSSLVFERKNFQFFVNIK
jgi:hypothetical protein